MRSSFPVCLAAILGCALTCSLAHSGRQDLFDLRLVRAVQSSPLGMASGDFDRDGRPDLAVSNLGSRSISILRCSVGEPLDQVTHYSVDGYPIRIITADFDLDGILDLAVTIDGGSQTVGILRGNGDGTFGSVHRHFAGPGTPLGITAADFDDDGRPDLAIVQAGTSSVSVLLNITAAPGGEPRFGAPALYAVTGLSPVDVAAADVNGDGIEDLVAGNQDSHSISVLLGSGNQGAGDGTFHSPIDYPTGTYCYGVGFGRLNADSLVDVLAVNGGSATVSVLLGDPDGGSTSPLLPAVNYRLPAGEPWSVAAGDLDADGLEDLLVAHMHRGISGLFGRGDGTFAETILYPSDGGGTKVVLADFNQDRCLDAAVNVSHGSRIEVLVGRCAAAAPTITGFRPAGGVVGSVVTVDGSGFDDVLGVAIAGVPAAFSVSSWTRLRARIPAGAVTGRITVTTARGTATSAADLFVGERPQILSAVPDRVKVGTKVVLSGRHFTTATRVAFGPESHATFNVDADDRITAWIDGEAATGPVSVTTLAATGTSAFVVEVDLQSVEPGVAGWTSRVPPGDIATRSQHSAVHDPLRCRMIVHGGAESGTSRPLGDTWALSLDAEPRWTQIAAQGAHPPTGVGHGAVYDPRADRVLLFTSPCGLWDTVYDNPPLARLESWALSLSDPPTWSALETGSPRPPGRCFFATVFHPETERALVLGGSFSFFFWSFCDYPLTWVRNYLHFTEVWALGLDGEDWPWMPVGYLRAGRAESPAAVLDPRRRRVIVIGGRRAPEPGTCGCECVYIDGGCHIRLTKCPPEIVPTTHELRLDGAGGLQEIEILGPQPGPRAGAAAIYDPVGDRVLLFGGRPATGPNMEVWELRLAEPPTWAPFSAFGTPPPAGVGHTAVYDPRGHAVWLYGGNPKVWRLQLPDREVQVDIWPGSSQTAVSRSSRGLIPVAILSSPEFDALTTDPATVRLAGASVRELGAAGVRDVNRDGLPDLVLYFEARELRLAPADSTAELVGVTRDGVRIHGRDRVRQVGAAAMAGLQSGQGDLGEGGGAEEPPSDRLGVSPNPVGEAFRLRFYAWRPGAAKLAIYDVSGRRVASRALDSARRGWQAVQVEVPRGLAAGLYLLRLDDGRGPRTHRLLVTR